jgi:hypothetical protein
VAIAALLVAGALYPITALAVTNNKLIVQSSTNPPVDKFVVTDTGFVGVGTNAPIVSIQTLGTTTTASQIMSQYINPSAASTAVPPTPVTGGGGGFVGYFNYPGNGMPINGDRLGYFLFGAYDTTGTGRNAAGFAAYAAGDWSATSIPSEFIFQTAPSTGGRVERLRISKDGNIVIGFPQTTPALDYSTFQKLEVNGGVRLNTATAAPTCDNSHDIRGTFWFSKGADTGGRDLLEICATDGSTIQWRKISFTP